MEELVNESKKSGNTSSDNSEYKKIHTKISNMRQIFSKNYRYDKNSKLKTQQRLKEILELEKLRAKLPSKTNGPGYRIYYVRYADDFLIGVNGDKNLAIEIKAKVSNFLKEKLHLQLNDEKTKITSAEKDRAMFLGTQVRISKSRTNDQKRRQESFTKENHKVRARLPQGKILLLAPIERIVRKLEEQGMCKVIDFSKRNVIPKRKSS